jgi:hypothetical protein
MEFADVVKNVVVQGGGDVDDGAVRHVPLDDDAEAWAAEDWLAEQEPVGAPETDELEGDVDSWFDEQEESDAEVQGASAPVDDRQRADADADADEESES